MHETTSTVPEIVIWMSNTDSPVQSHFPAVYKVSYVSARQYFCPLLSFPWAMTSSSAVLASFQ